MSRQAAKRIPHDLAYGKLNIKEILGEGPTTPILRGKQLSFWTLVNFTQQAAASTLLLAWHEGIRLLRLSLIGVLFSFGILRVTSLITVHLFFNLCFAFLVPALVFMPSIPLLMLVLILSGLLVMATRNR